MKKIATVTMALFSILGCIAKAETGDRLRAERELRMISAQQDQVVSISSEVTQQAQLRLKNAVHELANKLGATVQEIGNVELIGAFFSDVETKYSDGTLCNFSWSSGARGEFGEIECVTNRNQKLTGFFNSIGQIN